MTNDARALFSSNAAEERVELLWDRRGIDLISDALPAVQMETSHCLSHGLVQIPGGIFHVNTSDRNQPADFADWSNGPGDVASMYVVSGIAQINLGAWAQPNQFQTQQATFSAHIGPQLTAAQFRRAIASAAIASLSLSGQGSFDA
jgi:hypothetical protein